MDGLQRSFTARRLRARVIRAALVAVIAGIGLIAVPGTASAVGEVTPVVDCLRKNSDGSYTAVLGYTNRSSRAVTVPLGSRNKISPADRDGQQPTTFQPGTQRGVHTLTVTAAEYSRSGGYWSIDGNIAFVGQYLAPRATACPASTELPEQGNGTGPAIALAAAGLVGGVMVHRATRRARALTAADRGDA